MRKFLILIIFVSLIVGGIYFLGKSLVESIQNFTIADITFGGNSDQDDSKVEYANEYFEDSASGLKFIITNKSAELVVNKDKEKFVKDVFEEMNFSVAINAGFFLENWSHAGFLEVDKQILTSAAPNDKQLSGLVLINSGKISIEKIQDMSSVEGETVFQTGPIFVQDNIIQTDAIDQSLNGTGKYIRSFLGTTNTGETIIGISTKFVTLEDLANSLLQNSKFKDKAITIINLDGGSSTILYSNENDNFQVNLFKTLPFLLGFK